MLSRYNGPISRSLTLLFLRGIEETCGSGANLSILSVPSAFFSPAKMARSLLSASLRARRRMRRKKNVITSAMMTIASAMPIPSPARPPEVMPRRRNCVNKGAAAAVSRNEEAMASTATLCCNDFDIVVSSIGGALFLLLKHFWNERSYGRTWDICVVLVEETGSERSTNELVRRKEMIGARESDRWECRRTISTVQESDGGQD